MAARIARQDLQSDPERAKNKPTGGRSVRTRQAILTQAILKLV